MVCFSYQAQRKPSNSLKILGSQVDTYASTWTPWPISLTKYVKYAKNGSLSCIVCRLIGTYPGAREEDFRLLSSPVENSTIYKLVRKGLKKWGYLQVSGVRTVQNGHWQGIVEEVWVHTLTACCTHRHKVISVAHSCNIVKWGIMHNDDFVIHLYCT
jgi:hypothetical protein